MHIYGSEMIVVSMPLCVYNLGSSRICCLICNDLHWPPSEMLSYFVLISLVKHKQLNSLTVVIFVYSNTDYSMLEDVKRIADSAKRRRVNLCGTFCGAFSGFPPHLRGLLSAARSRRLKLLFLPKGMSKRQTNKTSFDNRFIFTLVLMIIN